MPDEAERIATIIDGPCWPARRRSFELVVSELDKLDGDPDLHQRIALEMIAAAGLNAPGTFGQIVQQLRSRYPTGNDVYGFIARGKRRVSLKTGKPIPPPATRPL